MNSVFLDTSGLVAVVNTDDQWHDVAEKAWQELIASSYPMVSSSLVLIELADGLSRVRHRPLALQVIDGLKSSSRVTILQSDSQLEERAWHLYCRRMDKEWGMTDCVSMTIMEDQKIHSVLTADSHFDQAGYEVLLK